MNDVQLVLGPVAFDSFEVPSRIRLGGKQVLAVHKLPGGARVIDAMGRDDAELRWDGVFSGPGAADRARLLDSLRVAGLTLPLSWDAFFYTVLIAELELDYSNPWWIPFRITCTVVLDGTAELAVAALSVATAVGQDLLSAASYFDISGLQSSLAADGATTRGTAAYDASASALASASASIDGQIASANALTSAADVPSAVSGAGQLAQLTAARGFIARAGVNLADAST